MSPAETPFRLLTPEEQIICRTTGFSWDWHVIILGKESISYYIKIT